jgi:hypothetical protein
MESNKIERKLTLLDVFKVLAGEGNSDLVLSGFFFALNFFFGIFHYASAY